MTENLLSPPAMVYDNRAFSPMSRSVARLKQTWVLGAEFSKILHCWLLTVNFGSLSLTSRTWTWIVLTLVNDFGFVPRSVIRTTNEYASFVSRSKLEVMVSLPSWEMTNGVFLVSMVKKNWALIPLSRSVPVRETQSFKGDENNVWRWKKVHFVFKAKVCVYVFY